MPKAFYIDDKLRVSIFYPEGVSLFSLLHSDPSNEHNLDNVLRNEPLSTNVRIKYDIAF
jgi:hypothetical protein